MMTDFTKQAKGILDESTRQAKGIIDESTRQAKGLIDESSARIMELRGEGLKVAEKVRESVENTVGNTVSMGRQAVDGISAELTAREKEIRGHLKVGQITDRINLAEIQRHTDAIRREILATLNVPSADVVDDLDVAVKKLNREIASFKTLKTELKKTVAENGKLKAAIKALKAEQKASFKALKADYKADFKAFKAAAKTKKTTKKA